MNKKHIFLLFLTLLPLSSLNSMQTQQNEPANLALALLYKLYAPHKIELNNIRKKLDIYLNKFRTFSAEIDTLVSIPELLKNIHPNIYSRIQSTILKDFHTMALHADPCCAFLRILFLFCFIFSMITFFNSLFFCFKEAKNIFLL
jgi:hypothetical protein